ncbi:MAG TPA: type II toxin-antitoxin system PemK/MazF family toxin [Myxococcaceae bacterium]|nr:type II toxin-antitoxin system PemK/MazF family toxin [Myxococcaceae bacterium]
MKRGEIWTASGGKDDAGKPRPVVIVQGDHFDATSAITVCPGTSDPTKAPLFRILVEPSTLNGLASASRLMVDKVITVPKAKLPLRRP